MPSPIDPKDENFEDASLRLNEGLRSCRAVVSSYRALLAGDGAEEAGGPALTETGDADGVTAG